jgi:hypothetical protein
LPLRRRLSPASQMLQTAHHVAARCRRIWRPCSSQTRPSAVILRRCQPARVPAPQFESSLQVDLPSPPFVTDDLPQLAHDSVFPGIGSHLVRSVPSVSASTPWSSIISTRFMHHAYELARPTAGIAALTCLEAAATCRICRNLFDHAFLNVLTGKRFNSDAPA